MHLYSDNWRMDWKDLLSELFASGMTQTVVAERIGVAQSAISELATGKTKEPRWTTGQKLRALHRSTKRRPSKQEAV